MSADTKFLALAGFLFALAILYREAPCTVIFLVIVLLAAAYFVVNGDPRR